MTAVPRIAFFTDSFYEINGVGLTSRHLEAFARRREFPFLTVRCGPRTVLRAEEPVWTFELARGPAAFAVDRDLFFDLLLCRHWGRLRAGLKAFRPDLIHITSPGDVGILGAWSAHRLGIPLLASWHTNLHEFGARRLEKLLSWLGEAARTRAAAYAEKGILECVLRLYRQARVLLAPNRDLVKMLRTRTGKPVFLMERGVDTDLFSPRRRDRSDGPFTLGFAGRLTPEKGVRFLAELERVVARQA